MSQSGADVTLPLEAVFLDRIAALEKSEKKRYLAGFEIDKEIKKIYREGNFGKWLVSMTPDKILDCMFFDFKCQNKEKLKTIINEETENHLIILAFFLEGKINIVRKQLAEMIEQFVVKRGIKRSELIGGSNGFTHYKMDGVRIECSIDDINNNIVKEGLSCGSFEEHSLERRAYDKYITEMLSDDEIKKILFDLSQKYYGVSEKDFTNLLKMLIKHHTIWYEFKMSKFNSIDDYLDYKEGLLSNSDLEMDKKYGKYIVVKEGTKKQARENFKMIQECKIASNPKLPRDFGLSAELRPGVIDTIKADYLSKAAQSNSYIKDNVGLMGEIAVQAYRNCLAAYGATIAQAYLNLTADLNDLKASVSKDENGNITVRGMGYDDFIILADAALQKALKDITNSTIKRTYERATQDNSPCQFDRSIENIKCGSSLIILGTKPQLFISGVQWYGERFAGYQGAYKVSKSWSYQDAIEKLKSTSKYSKWASEVSKYAEELESQGKTREATLVRKKAWELAKSGKQSVSPAKLIPGL
ncbi:MAG: hypothetical protein M0Z70_03575 [Nitrospiraceae bacterium]|nr:hypothetical protein [Nitrospiraceae bacterium]